MERLNHHYELLRIKPGAKLDEIKQAYLLAVQNLHEDRQAEDPLVRHQAQERLRKINEAFREITDAYQEVQASLGGGPDHFKSNRSAMATGIAAVKTAGETGGSSREDNNSVIPKEHGQPEVKSRSVAAAGQQHGESAPGDASFSVPGDTPDDRAEITDEKGVSDNSHSDKDETDSADSTDLLKKESFLLFSVVALVFLVMVITWIRTVRKSSPPEVAVKSTAPVEAVRPSRETSAPAVAVPKSGQKAIKDHPVEQPAAKDTADAGVVIREAEQGNAKAQALLGYMFMAGKGVRKDPAAAVKWFRSAAAQGDPRAEDWLGYLYETGTGVPRNYPEAARWYRLAADQGDADAQKNLGRMYSKGRGVAKSRLEAIKWLRKAATQGNEEAQRALEIWHED